VLERANRSNATMMPITRNQHPSFEIAGISRLLTFITTCRRAIGAVDLSRFAGL